MKTKKTRRSFKVDTSHVEEVLDEPVCDVQSEPEFRVDWSDTLSPEELRACTIAEEAAASKPDISRLKPAIVDGWPVFVEGDKIIIERYCTLIKGRPYLDTITYRVMKVDLVTGKVNLFNEELRHHAMDNWRHGIRWGYVYKFAPEKGVSVTLLKGMRKRGRPCKEKVDEMQDEQSVDPNAPRRGRGRPKGSKNRDRSEIIAEKNSKAEEKRLKKEARKSRTK